LGDRAFDSYMTDLLIIVSALSLGVKIGVGISGDYKDCSVGGGRCWIVAEVPRFVAEVEVEDWLRS
jgi:hypothetical protein